MLKYQYGDITYFKSTIYNFLNNIQNDKYFKC